MLKVDLFQMFRGQSLLYTPPLVPLGPVAGGGPVVDYAVTGQRFAVVD